MLFNLLKKLHELGVPIQEAFRTINETTEQHFLCTLVKNDELANGTITFATGDSIRVKITYLVSDK